MISTPFKIGGLTIPNRLIMAPMCNITHLPFRRLIKNYGAGLVMTQMVSAKALTMGCTKTRKLLSFDLCERPIAFQVFGNNAPVLAEAAVILQDLGADLVDLNMGCPAKKIVNDGGGSALLKNPLFTAQILEAMRKVLRIPFTIKMRAGYDKYSEEFLSIAQMAERCGVDGITLHGRTKTQGYTGLADWELVRLLKEAVKIPIIGNGDINSPEKASLMLEQTGCDAVMIGRAAVSEPWFFKSVLEEKSFEPTPAALRSIILNQYHDFFDFYGASNGVKMMRKHLCSYTRGMRNGASFRNEIITLNDWEMIESKITHFFDDSVNEM